MKRKRYTETQILKVLKESEAGRRTGDIVRQYGISEKTLYNWKRRYGGLEASDLRQLKNLDRIRPAVFAKSVLPMLGIEVPRVQSGSYTSATITTSLTATTKAKGGTAEASAAAWTRQRGRLPATTLRG